MNLCNPPRPIPQEGVERDIKRSIMNEHNGNDQNQSTVLKLNQFVPGQPLASVNKAGSAETVTGIIVRQAAREVCERSPQPVVAPKDENALPAQSLLGVVSYCYAKGVFTSEDIERKLRLDPALKAACGEDLPDSLVIRRFRRLNRTSIVATLEQLFRFRRKHAVTPAGLAAHDLETKPAPHSQALDACGESTIMAAHTQAQEHLDKAAFIDNMSRDQ